MDESKLAGLEALHAAARRVVGVFPTTAATSMVPSLGVIGPASGEYAPLDLAPVGHAPTVEYLAAAAEAVPELCSLVRRLRAELAVLRPDVSVVNFDSPAGPVPVTITKSV